MTTNADTTLLFAALDSATGKVIGRTCRRHHTRELEDAIRLHLALYNQKPFVWVNTADQILASVARFCQLISVSGSVGNASRPT